MKETFTTLRPHTLRRNSGKAHLATIVIKTTESEFPVHYLIRFL